MALGVTGLVEHFVPVVAARDEVVEGAEREVGHFSRLFDRRVEEPDAFLGVFLLGVLRAVDVGAGDGDDFEVVAIRVEGGLDHFGFGMDECVPEVGAEVVESHCREWYLCVGDIGGVAYSPYRGVKAVCVRFGRWLFPWENADCHSIPTPMGRVSVGV